MSVHVSSWVWKHSKAKDHQLLVLLALADMANDEGKSWPSMRTLCERCRISERSAQGAVKQSALDGELRILPQEGPNWVNVYQFTAFEATPAKSAPPLKGAAVPPAKSAPLPPQNLRPSPAGPAPGGAKHSKNTPAESAPKTLEEEPSEETSTTTQHAGEQTKATQPTKNEVVVVSSGSRSYEAQAENDAETLEDLESDFGLNPEQAGKLRACYKRQGIAYVEEKAELTRAEPRKNAAAFFMLALEKNWKAPVKIDKKTKPTKPEPPKEEVPARPDYSAQWELWQRASDEQREAWRQDHLIRQLEPKAGEKPRTAFLARLQGLTQPQEAVA